MAKTKKQKIRAKEKRRLKRQGVSVGITTTRQKRAGSSQDSAHDSYRNIGNQKRMRSTY